MDRDCYPSASTIPGDRSISQLVNLVTNLRGENVIDTEKGPHIWSKFARSTRLRTALQSAEEGRCQNCSVTLAKLLRSHISPIEMAAGAFCPAIPA